MGAAFSTQSYLRYQNDFELVIRATKDLECLLEEQFDVPTGKTVGLHEKISAAQQSHGLSSSTVRQMRKLVTIRNQLVHNPSCNSLEDRHSFAKTFDSVEKELKGIMAARSKGKPSDGGCAIM